MSISKNIGITYLSQVAGLFISVASTVFLSRILGTEGRGEFTLYSNSVTFVNLFIGLSLPSTIVYAVANERIQEQKLFMSLMIYVLLSVGLVWLLIQGIFSLGYAGMIFPAGKQSVAWRWLFILHFFSLTMNSFLIAFMNARKQFVISSIVGLVNILLPLIGYMLMYYKVIPLTASQVFTGVVLWVVLAFVSTTLAMGLILFRYYAASLSFQLLDKADWLFVLRFSVMAWLCNFITNLTYRMDMWFVDHYHGKAATGIYSLAVNLSQFFWVLPNAIGGVLYSYIAKDGIRNHLENIQRLTKFTFYFNGFGALAGILCLQYLIPAFYGEAFAGSYDLLVLLLPGVVFFSITIIMATLFAGTGNIHINLYNTLFSFIVCLILDILVIRYWSATGASLVSSITYLASTGFSLLLVFRLFGVKFRSLFLLQKEDILFLKNKFIK